MSGILATLTYQPGTTSSVLDTQTVTTGGTGTALNSDRQRGFISGSIGSIADGTSNIYSGGAITGLYWDEGAGGGATYVLTIPTATNTGWTQVTIGVKTFTRASATFTSGSWYWNTTDTVSTQAFGTIGSNVTATFT